MDCNNSDSIFPMNSENVTLSSENNFSNFNFSQIDCSDFGSGNSALNSSYFQAVISVLYSIIFLVALLGNGAVCFIVRAFPRMRTVTNYFIANLALGDILMSVFCVPFTFLSQLVLNHWPFGSFLCRLVNYSQAVSVLVSAYTLVALAADRCRAITQPLKPRLSTPTVHAAIAGVWIGALATAAPIPIVSVLSSPTPYHEICSRSICREEWPHPEQFYYYSMALMGLQFVIPLAVLVFTYTRIAIAVWGERPPGEAENSRDRRMAKSKRKMIKMMVTVVIVFTVCWLPFNVLIVLWTINTDDNSWDTWEALPYVWFAFHWLAMSHSCYNPIIYCYMNARFRYSFIQVAARMPCLKSCLGGAASRAARADMHNGVGMTETSLHRMNTCTTYISLRRRTVRCSCSRSPSSVRAASCNCSPARSSHSLSPMKDTLYPRNTCTNISPTCTRRSSSRSSKNTLSSMCASTDTPCANNRDNTSSCVCRRRESSCRPLNNDVDRKSPIRTPSFLTPEGTVSANDRRRVSYLEDQI